MSKRQRRKRAAREKRIGARKQQYQRRIQKLGIASEYIFEVLAYLKTHPNAYFVLWIRTSTKDQGKRKDSSDVQEWALRSFLHEHGLTSRIAGVFVGENEKAYVNQDRPYFERAIECARRHNAAILVRDRTRVIRHIDFDGSNDSDQVADHEFKVLAKCGVDLVSIIQPDENGRSESVIYSDQYHEQFDTDAGWRKRRKDYLQSALLGFAEWHTCSEIEKDRLSQRELAVELSERCRGRFKPVDHGTAKEWLDETVKFLLKDGFEASSQKLSVVEFKGYRAESTDV
ncbi:recombinase family protein [Coraliomargarita sp. W4R72]